MAKIDSETPLSLKMTPTLVVALVTVQSWAYGRCLCKAAFTTKIASGTQPSLKVHKHFKHIRECTYS